MTDAPFEERRFAGAEDLTLAATAWGHPGDPCVLLLHGAGQSRQAWRHAARAIAATGWYAVALDHRGHGDSDWPEGSHYEFDHFADDVEAVLEQLPSPPVLIGASLGGIAGLVAQGRTSRQLYAGLVLVDVTPALDFTGVRRIMRFMSAHPQGFASLADASLAIADYTGREPPAQVDGLRSVLRLDQASDRWRWHWDPRFLDDKIQLLDAEGTADEGAVAARAALIRGKLDAAAINVHVPTLIVRGAKSDLVTPDAVRALQAIIPGSEYVDVAEAGHMVAGDDNDTFTAAVLDFLHRIGTG
jgi:pimeloyl-ACP methyl ester carboxylesterase